jgi:hypothetical protein
MKFANPIKTILVSLDLYVTIVAAIGLSIANLIGNWSATWINSVSLATLGVLAYNALRNRYRSNMTVGEIKKINDQTTRVCEKIALSEMIRTTGLFDIKSQSREVDWDSLFRNVKEIDLFFTYARTWRNTVENLLYSFLKIKGARLRVILPDPYNNVVLKELSNRFAKSEGEFRDLIIDATNHYYDMSCYAKVNNGATLELWHTSVTPMFSLYRFDKTVIISLGSYKSYKGDVPHFLADRRGALYKFAQDELDTLFNNNGRNLSSRILYPEDL